jgi:hypothetical protein
MEPIILVEDYPCETGEQASAQEAFYVLNNACVNKQKPGRSLKEKNNGECENGIVLTFL